MDMAVQRNAAREQEREGEREASTCERRTAFGAGPGSGHKGRGLCMPTTGGDKKKRCSKGKKTGTG